MVRNLPCVPVSAECQFLKKIFLPRIYKTGFFPEDCIPSCGLEGVDKTVLCHPLLAGLGELLLKEYFGAGMTQFGEDRTFPDLTLEGAVLQTDPEDAVKGLPHQ